MSGFFNKWGKKVKYWLMKVGSDLLFYALSFEWGDQKCKQKWKWAFNHKKCDRNLDLWKVKMWAKILILETQPLKYNTWPGRHFYQIPRWLLSIASCTFRSQYLGDHFKFFRPHVCNIWSAAHSRSSSRSQFYQSWSNFYFFDQPP